MIRINLLPVRQTRKLEAARLELGLAVAGGVAVFLFSLATWGFFTLQLASIRGENKVLQGEIDRLAADVAKVDEMEKFKAEFERKLTVIDDLRKTKSGPVRMLDEIATATPERLYITQLEEKAGALQVSGVSVSNDVISQFLRALEGSAYFEQVFLQDIEALPAEKNLSVTLKKFKLTAKMIAPSQTGTEGAAAPAGAAPAPTDPPATNEVVPAPAGAAPPAPTPEAAAPPAAASPAPAPDPAPAAAPAPAPGGGK
jgi:type IV pilus assembly protein PilN